MNRIRLGLWNEETGNLSRIVSIRHAAEGIDKNLDL